MLKLSQGESLGQQTKRYRFCPEFGLDLLDRFLNHFVVIKTKTRNIIKVNPMGVMSFQNLMVNIRKIQQCRICNRHYPLSRISLDLSESTYLVHIYAIKSCQILQNPLRGVVNTLIIVDKTTH